MEPPSEYQSPHDDEQWGTSSSRYYSPQRQQRHYEQEQPYQQSYSLSRGRSSSRYHTSSSGNHNGGGRPQSSSSNTPRRKGNPQSSSPSIDGRIHQQHELQQQHQQSPASAQSSYTKPSQPLTHLSSLSTILLTHQSQVTTTLKLYRQSHSLHRHATDRTTRALERLREAQAELEHATTAAEFAKEELSTATIQKDDAQDAMKTMCKRVRSLSKSLVNKRVRLVGLSKNMSWNGRLGTIVKMVTDGGSEDVGRWKVRLDSDWRGRDADGIADDEHNEEQHGYDGGSSNVVVAKAENLQLLDEQQHFDADADANLLERKLSNCRSSKASSSQKRPQKHQVELEYDTTIPQSKSRDPEQEEYDTVQLDILHHGGVPTSTATNYRRTGRDPSINDDVSPVRSTARNSNRGQLSAAEVVTPDSSGNNKNGGRGDGRSYSRERSADSYRNLTPASYYKSDNGRYHDSTSPRQQRQSLTRRQVSPSKDAMQEQQPHQRQPSQSKCVPRQSKSRPPRTSPRNYPTPSNKSNSNSQYDHMSIQKSPSNESTRISAAFSRMLLSPVTLTPREINPENDGMRDSSSQQWVNEDNRQYDGLEQRRGGNRGQPGNSPARQFKPLNASPGGGDVVSIAGSFFDEVTSLDKNIALGNDAFGQRQQDDDDADPHLQPYHPSHEETVDCTNDGHPLPYIVVLPVDEDDNDINNPFMSPGYQDNSPPHCVGVQDAGVDHVNGVYLLAYPKDEHGNAIIPQDGESTPPLYFRDGPSIQLQDGREYDMCILRINCPDSPDHVIWFLARVDCDPDCLDVKFSDCYYYCRMLRNDDGCGGEIVSEDDVEPCQRPPSRGWNVPKLPPGVEMLPIATPSCDASSSAMSGMKNHNQQRHGSDDGNQHGLGILPRQPSDADDHYDGEGKHISPGMNSKMSRTTYSKYSI